MTDPTLRQAAILVGGLGSRLGALTAQTPKPLLPVGDRPFLAWLLRELCRFGVEEALLLAGFRADMLEAQLPSLQARLPRPMALKLVREPAPAGTGGALARAAPHLAERFLLCNGDSWLDGNLARLLAEAKDDPPGVQRLWLCPVAEAGRYGVVRHEGGRIHAFSPGRPGPAEIYAGIGVFERDAVAGLAVPSSLEREALPAWAAAGRLRATVAGSVEDMTVGRTWFIDIGIPSDLARSRAEIPARLRRPALFLDRDGVINVDHGYVGNREEFDFVSGALAAIAAAVDAGWHVFVATNQSGIARGRYSEADFAALSAWMIGVIRAAGGTIDDLRHCPYHPEAPLAAYRRTSDWRKPAPGMLRDLMAHWELAPGRCVLVGDQASDLAAAAAAGIAGHLFAGGDLARFVRPLLATPEAMPAASPAQSG